MREKYKKHPHNQYFLVRGLAFIMKKSEPLIIKYCCPVNMCKGLYSLIFFALPAPP